MAKIVRILENSVNIGMDDGSLITVSMRDLNFCPSLGDEVEVYRSADQIIVAKAAQQYAAQQYATQQYATPQYATPAQQPIVINNNNINTNTNIVRGGGRMKDKWIAFLLCLFLGGLGAHKFYEGKIGMGILYLCTGGLLWIGVIIDLISILGKPNPYYV